MDLVLNLSLIILLEKVKKCKLVRSQALHKVTIGVKHFKDCSFIIFMPTRHVAYMYAFNRTPSTSH